MLPFLLLQILDNCKVSWEVGGHCRKVLQSNLFRKFLNYKASTRQEITTGDITMAIMRDIREVVDFGFVKTLQVARILLKLALTSIFLLSENRAAAIPFAVFPPVMVFFLLWRGGITITTNEDMAHSENNMVQTVNNCVHNFQLIADFHLRPYMVGRFEDSIDDFNRKEMSYRHVHTNNRYLFPWITTIFVGVYMIFGTFQLEVFGGTVSLGAFLATINVFKEVGLELQEIYLELMEIQTSFGPLRNLTRLMNLPTDLEQRMWVNRSRRKSGETRWDLARKNSTESVDGNGHHIFAVDRVPIELEDVSYSHSDAKVVDRVSMKFPQGKFYTFIGPSHQGKATLLKLIGQVLVPQLNSGTIHVPPNLRVLHVSRDTYVLNEPLLVNLIFNTDIAKLGGFVRVRKICERCGFSKHMLETLDAQEPKPRSSAANFAQLESGQASVWHEESGESPDMTLRNERWAIRLSHADHARLNIARALVLNPECLVMHKPVIAFSDEEARHIMALIRMHVDERGLELSAEDRHFRRPRTVFR